jgi:hypothetical protein
MSARSVVVGLGSAFDFLAGLLLSIGGLAAGQQS